MVWVSPRGDLLLVGAAWTMWAESFDKKNHGPQDSGFTYRRGYAPGYKLWLKGQGYKCLGRL